MNKLTQKALSLAEIPFIRSATVLAVRVWEPDTVREVDIHLPDCDVSKWTSTQHIKFKVDSGVYRDYTPAGWDGETRTCTIIMHTAHDGPGSRWAKQLHAGDTVMYLGVASSHQQPVKGKPLVFLGDETTIGHFLALQQLAGAGASINGALVMAEPHHRDEFGQYFLGWGLQSLRKGASRNYGELEGWLEDHAFSEQQDAVFYLAGYSPEVGRLRKLLRKKGVQVVARGFWD
ncbi:MAG: siderophore-interacting protein [Bacteroidetes bacterium]|nr:siderophore-interacting protein [Bacteroidota bacterium]